jgi:hypothetical protein
LNRFASSEELFDAVRSLIRRMEDCGRTGAAAELRAGFGCLDGLTDGWAVFMESIEKVLAAHRTVLPPDQCAELKTILKAVKKIVFR